MALELSPEGSKRDALKRDLKEMEHLIAALLEREQLRSRTGRIEGEEVDVAAVAADAIVALAGQGPGVKIVSNGIATLQSDPALRKLLIQNLVDNAVKFSHPDSRPIVVTSESDSQQVVLRVADDGLGIPEGDEERIFEPFVKLDRARGLGVGYGLGLDLCRRIVELYGGTIRLLPRQPRGTEAVVTFDHYDTLSPPS